MANESIDKILTELNKVEFMLKQFRITGKLPDIERDIVLAKLRNIYEFINLVQLQEVEQPQPPHINEEIVEEVQTILKEEATIVLEPEPEITAVPVEEIEKKIEVEKPKEHTDEIPVIPLVSKKTETSTPILAEQFQQNKSFLNETLAKFQNLQDISKKYQNKPIGDISSAINLNDKFLYIKELFNNDGDLYKHTIEILNNAGDFNQAVQYLDENFQWDFNDFQVQKILELVHRRYMPADE